MSWFAEWFNSPYYHVLYKDRDTLEGQIFIDNLDNLLHFEAEHKILDLACGKGRHAIYLNTKGLNVLGIDLSPESILYASQFQNDRLNFEVQDMRNPVAINRFDFVLNLFTSFGYFKKEEDNLNTIKSISKSMKLDGVLVIDFFNTHKVISQLIENEQKIIDGITFHINKKVVHSIILKTITFDTKGQSFCFNEKVSALYLNDFEQYCKLAGLQITDTFGDYNLATFDKETSDRLIVIAKKITDISI